MNTRRRTLADSTASNLVGIGVWMTVCLMLNALLIYYLNYVAISAGPINEMERAVFEDDVDVDVAASVLFRSIESITFCAVPYPSRDSKQLDRVKLAIASWLAVSPRSRVMLFTSRSKFDRRLLIELERIFGVGRIEFVGRLPRSKRVGAVKRVAQRTSFADIGDSIQARGALPPLVSEWFRRGVNRSKSRYICFINMDIVLDSRWLPRAKQIFEFTPHRRLLVIGRRFDMNMTAADFGRIKWTRDGFHASLAGVLADATGQLLSEGGVDFFLFRVDLAPINVSFIPPFFIGRYGWDSWMVGWAKDHGTVVSMWDNPCVYHVEHRHHKWVNNSLVSWNARLRRNTSSGGNADAHWIVENDALAPGYLEGKWLDQELVDAPRREETPIPLPTI